LKYCAEITATLQLLFLDFTIITKLPFNVDGAGIFAVICVPLFEIGTIGTVLRNIPVSFVYDNVIVVLSKFVPFKVINLVPLVKSRNSGGVIRARDGGLVQILLLLLINIGIQHFFLQERGIFLFFFFFFI
jgi:hypothetical protein